MLPLVDDAICVYVELAEEELDVPWLIVIVRRERTSKAARRVGCHEEEGRSLLDSMLRQHHE